ncbi:CDP-glycerol glycerophosphotransferase family protein [Arcobacter sp. FWKO B]|uniref:CDP-glycerol glycerophosphotransferase family protein n=1 Tax=Arcobacter sp. FWKO B TaxID=2593672 RepID=UPI0018A40514|nr:CDP-glycerol glycerophosphotransferase family protein [Arcobacter sp. FWKO B]QOG11271.1 hypothetical protein FWKOB_00555 [Arcobacter sp. FWKO B]
MKKTIYNIINEINNRVCCFTYRIKLYNVEGFKTQCSNLKKNFFKLLIFMLILAFLEYFSFETPFLFLLSVLLFVYMSYKILYIKYRRPKKQIEYNNLVKDYLENYQPQIVFYLSATTISYFHILTWYKFVKQTNINFIIITRENNYIKKLLEYIKDTPIVYARTIKDIDFFLPSSVKIALYANNGAKNTHLVRFNNITHIQLLHGDSEKTTSFNPISKMYDKLFVAGQRAIDRYCENNVIIPKDNFVIIGRPQVSDIEVVKTKENIGKKDVITVLLAPTWQGHYEDSNYSSVMKIGTIIEYLLSRKEKIKIIFRPHPYINMELEENKEYFINIKKALKQNSKEHIFDSKNSIFDDFNQSDFIVTDVSSVPIDYLYSQKPIVHLDVNNLSYELNSNIVYKEYSKCIYLIIDDFSNADSIIDDVLYNDNLFEARKKVKKYYHGEFDIPLQDVFTRELKKLL